MNRLLTKLVQGIKTSFISKKIPSIFFSTLALICGISLASGRCSFFSAITIIIILIGICLKNYPLKPLYALFCFGAFALGVLRIKQEEKALDFFHKKTTNTEYIDVRVVHVQKKTTGTFKVQLTVTLERIKKKEREINGTHDNFLWYTLYDNDLLPGDYLRIYNPIFTESKSSSFTDYLLKYNNKGALFSYTHNFRLLQRPHTSLTRRIHSYRLQIKKSLEEKMSPLTATLFSYMFLGSPTDHTNETEFLQKNFFNWGLNHYLARSGLHVALLLFFLNRLLSFLLLPYRLRAILGILFMLFYTIITWTTISYMRALIMFLATSISIVSFLPAHTLYIFCLCTFGILLYYPYQLFALDFQLSFGLTWLLIWLQDLNARKIFSSLASKK
jgi:ComEC/Rec2-related protein